MKILCWEYSVYFESNTCRSALVCEVDTATLIRTGLRPQPPVFWQRERVIEVRGLTLKGDTADGVGPADVLCTRVQPRSASKVP